MVGGGEDTAATQGPLHSQTKTPSPGLPPSSQNSPGLFTSAFTFFSK